MTSATILQVSELTDLIKKTLESDFQSVNVEGEISNWRPAASGHVYFSLKDQSAMIQAVMFRNKAGKLAFKPADGILVRVSGQVSVYPARGNYQIIVETMDQAGIGDLLRKLEELKRNLSAEGLFDESRKRPIPAFPSRVGVVTSPTGAAIRDILNVLHRRNSLLNVIVFPAMVQGSEAPEMIVRQIETANRYAMADVLIVGRGGGSIEDLLPFSDERVVRAVAGSSIPVISAVGHEIDWALTDFAADLRAPTPSAAAELVSENAEAVGSRLSELERFLGSAIAAKITNIRLMLDRFRPENLEMQFRKMEQPWLQRFDDAKELLVQSFRDKVRSTSRRVAVISADLEARSPRSILERGFAIVTDPSTGKPVHDSSRLRVDMDLNIAFAKGKSTVTVKELQQ